MNEKQNVVINFYFNDFVTQHGLVCIKKKMSVSLLTVILDNLPHRLLKTPKTGLRPTRSWQKIVIDLIELRIACGMSGAFYFAHFGQIQRNTSDKY